VYFTYEANLMVRYSSSLAHHVAACKLTKIPGRHDVPDEDKKAYIAAELCIMNAPAKLNKMPGAKTRWDELVGLHQVLALQIHSTGTFLPYHRYILHAHEYLLSECGYKKGLP